MEIRADGLNHPPPALLFLPPDRRPRRLAQHDGRGAVGARRHRQPSARAPAGCLGRQSPGPARESQDGRRDSGAVHGIDLLRDGDVVARGWSLFLALVGIYSVVSYVAVERTSEIGIRMALGAQTADVRRLLLGHGLALTLTGIVVGLGAAVVITAPISSLLYGVKPLDPATYATVALLLTAVTLLAMYLPVRRACRVEPSIAMRRNG
ncbi:MAG: FtsX-like permease family protein [Vicinamibacterales bacterium]